MTKATTATATTKAVLPDFSFYGPGTDGYNGRAIRFNVGPLTLWYSYETIVAFQGNGERVVCQNQWGVTTGKHLNAIDGGDKKGRLPRAEFEAQLSACLTAFGLAS